MAAVTIVSAPTFPATTTRRRAPGGAWADRPPVVVGPSAVVRPLAVPGPGGVGAATYRRRRLVAVLLGLGLVLVAGGADTVLGGVPLAAPEHAPAASIQPGARGSVVVGPGDTLWSIAVALADGGDPRPVVDRLVAAHGPGPLLPGETVEWAP